MKSDHSDQQQEFSASEDDWEVIADYVTHQASPDVRAAVEARQRGDAAFREALAAALLVWERVGAVLHEPVGAVETEQARLRLVAELDAGTGAATTATSPAAHAAIRTAPTMPARGGRAQRAPRFGWRKAALVTSIVALAGIALTYVASRLVGGADTVAPVALREIVATRGQRVAVTLSDGGRGILAPGSTLRAPEQFAADERRVSLSGRAYFEIAHDAARPFVVETDRAIVRVLGTEFDVRAYGGSDAPEVVVRSGRVALRPTGATADTILGRGDRGIIDASGRVTIETGVNVAALLNWTTGRLVFERTTLAAVVADLERWHDVTIELADSSLAGMRLTAEFDHEPLDIILKTVAELVNARVQRDGQRVLFTSANSRR